MASFSKVDVTLHIHNVYVFKILVIKGSCCIFKFMVRSYILEFEMNLASALKSSTSEFFSQDWKHSTHIFRDRPTIANRLVNVVDNLDVMYMLYVLFNKALILTKGLYQLSYTIIFFIWFFINNWTLVVF